MSIDLSEEWRRFSGMACPSDRVLASDSVPAVADESGEHTSIVAGLVDSIHKALEAGAPERVSGQFHRYPLVVRVQIFSQLSSSDVMKLCRVASDVKETANVFGAMKTEAACDLLQSMTDIDPDIGGRMFQLLDVDARSRVQAMQEDRACRDMVLSVS